MPLKRCTSGGEKGWKWGDRGKCYTGPDAKKKAIKQAIAIATNKGIDPKEYLSKEDISVADALIILAASTFSK